MYKFFLKKKNFFFLGKFFDAMKKHSDQKCNIMNLHLPRIQLGQKSQNDSRQYELDRLLRVFLSFQRKRFSIKSFLLKCRAYRFDTTYLNKIFLSIPDICNELLDDDIIECVSEISKTYPKGMDFSQYKQLYYAIAKSLNAFYQLDTNTFFTVLEDDFNMESFSGIVLPDVISAGILNIIAIWCPIQRHDAYFELLKAIKDNILFDGRLVSHEDIFPISIVPFLVSSLPIFHSNSLFKSVLPTYELFMEIYNALNESIHSEIKATQNIFNFQESPILFRYICNETFRHVGNLHKGNIGNRTVLKLERLSNVISYLPYRVARDFHIQLFSLLSKISRNSFQEFSLYFDDFFSKWIILEDKDRYFIDSEHSPSVLKKITSLSSLSSEKSSSKQFLDFSSFSDSEILDDERIPPPFPVLSPKLTRNHSFSGVQSAREHGNSSVFHRDSPKTRSKSTFVNCVSFKSPQLHLTHKASIKNFAFSGSSLDDPEPSEPL
eukprot:TRINITY_DN1923_c0_g1_i1.p1 TRINITY_DN1923_c0_g1~~TRINITY_DN1923_c0_g1_i1.p1  ORF type:complete len:492 (-),score=108.15 TRINITY_DN1923_c0_g1_i1:49-1524(-)